MLRIAPSRTGNVRITFALPVETPPASVVGDFNGWDPYAAPLRRRNNGTRSAVVEVPAGTRLRFRYLLDGGRWLGEPDADLQPDTGDAVLTV
jgi:1,4-alpha-glucan branching enzyme